MKALSLNYDFKTTDKALEWVDSLYIKYDIPYGFMAYLEHIATGGLVECDSEQSIVIENILKHEGFNYIIE